jgi:hypothetical protein
VPGVALPQTTASSTIAASASILNPVSPFAMFVAIPTPAHVDRP